MKVNPSHPHVIQTVINGAMKDYRSFENIEVALAVFEVLAESGEEFTLVVNREVKNESK